MSEDNPVSNPGQVEEPAQPALPAATPLQPPVIKPPKDNSNKKWLAAIGVLLVSTAITSFLLWNNTSGKNSAKTTATTISASKIANPQTASEQGLKLDQTKSY